MRGNNSDRLLRLGLIFVGLLVIILGGIYVFLTFTIFEPVQEIVKPVLETPTVNIPTRTPTSTEELRIVATTAVPTNSPTVTATAVKPTSTPTPNVPPGGIVYALSPDVNSVGWVQSGEKGNHFGESFLYTGLRDGTLSHGAMQFNLAFIPNGSTIFLAELELTGLADEGLTADSVFEVNILAEDIDANWSRHNFEAIHNAVVDETLTPLLNKSELSPENVNKFVFNAAQRSIIEQRLESNFLSFRLDSLTPDQEGWFAWDSGYGEQSQGRGPILRLGVLPPVATEVAETDIEVFSTPTSTPTFVVVTSTPTPENLQTAAAIALVATAQATTTGTSTPIPANWVTPVVVTETPTPGNAATAQFQQAEATAAVIVFGTLPPNIVVATPTPTATASPIFIPLEGELPPTRPVPLPTLNVQFTPAELIGKIAFKSDRTGREEYYVINPDGSGLALLTNCWAYNLAEQADFYSSDGRFRVFTKDFARYRKIESAGGGPELNVREDVPAIFWYDAFYKQEQQLTQLGLVLPTGGYGPPPVSKLLLFQMIARTMKSGWLTEMVPTSCNLPMINLLFGINILPGHRMARISRFGLTVPVMVRYL